MRIVEGLAGARARRLVNAAPRRFYQSASALAAGEGFGVMLDARALKTPGGALFCVPTHALASACAGEWEAQGERIAPQTMPLTQLGFAAIDHARREESAAYIARYAETDLICHRAETTAGLAAAQAEMWDPLLAWARSAHGLDLRVTAGVIAAPADADSVARVRDIAARLDDFHRTALAQATGLAGSVIIALALLGARLDGAGAFAAATVDDAWNIAHWGEDGEARARLDRLRADLTAVWRFATALEVP